MPLVRICGGGAASNDRPYRDPFPGRPRLRRVFCNANRAAPRGPFDSHRDRTVTALRVSADQFLAATANDEGTVGQNPTPTLKLWIRIPKCG
jgi:hypothetical protein